MKIIKNKISFTFILLTLVTGLRAQLSLWNDRTLPDTVRMKALDEYAWSIVYSQPDSAEIYAHQLLKMAGEQKNNFYEAYANNTIGVSYDVRSRYSEALIFYRKNIFLYRKMNDKRGEASAEMNTGIIFYNQGLYKEALKHYKRSVTLYEEAGDKNGLAGAYVNISVIIKIMQRYEESMEFVKMAEGIFLEMKDTSWLAIVYHNKADLYKYLKQSDSAWKYFEMGLQLNMKSNNLYGVATTYSRMGALADDLFQFDKAIDYFNKASRLFQQINDPTGMIGVQVNSGNVLLKQGKTNAALDSCEKAYRMSLQLNTYSEHNSSCGCLYDIYKKKGDNVNALRYFEEYIQGKDSIFGLETAEMVAHLEFQYKYMRRSFADSVKNAQKQKILDAQIEAQNAKIDVQNAQLEAEESRNFFLVIFILLLLAFAFIVFNRFRITSRQKKIIEEQKKDVEFQKEIVEEKNKNITDSINYALRIQQSFLPKTEDMNSVFSDYFIFYLPKDIVSGDFFWMTKGTVFSSKNEKSDAIIFSIADCTGHGVPGAMMTMIGNTLLNQTISNPSVKTPAEALDFLNNELPKNLKKQNQQAHIRDGMDMAMIAIDKNNGKLFFAGANTSLLLIRNNEMTEYKGDKQPISAGDDVIKQNFSLSEIEIKQGDCLYMTTDGFPDQFGSFDKEKTKTGGKKFKMKRLKEILLKNHLLPMEKQKQELQHTFQVWRGELEQVDDVCVIGIKIG
ncbi:MAG: SpoIIE family protein phosphatase [Bacteroidota bacterium]